MSIALIGGMDRLQQHYRKEAERSGVDIKVFNRPESGMGSRIRNVDAIVIFTNKVSHEARREVMRTARTKKIPVFMYHACGVCSFRDCLDCIKKTKYEEEQQ